MVEGLEKIKVEEFEGLGSRDVSSEMTMTKSLFTKKKVINTVVKEKEQDNNPSDEAQSILEKIKQAHKIKLKFNQTA